jgi:replicative DNA helicase
MSDIDKYIQELEADIKAGREGVEKEEAILRIQQIARAYRGDDEVVSSHTIEKLMENEPEESKMLSGIPAFDRILSGFRPQQLIVLAGITKHGKTQFSMELITRLCEHKPTLLSFEEPVRELIRKFKDSNLSTPLFYTPKQTTNNQLDWIEKKMVEAKAKYDTKIVFIDHLGYITGAVSENRSYEIESTMKHLKSLAKKWDIIIFLLAHLSKSRLDRNPDLEDLKGSSAIAQEADTVIMLWRKTERVNGEVQITNEVTLSIQANRRTGATGNVHLVFSGGRYLESDFQHTEDGAEEQWRTD